MSDAFSHHNDDIRHFYFRTAYIGARWLPDDLEFDLVHVWIADTRGESFAIPDEFDGFMRERMGLISQKKEEVERAARKGGFDVAEAKRRVPLNVCWALKKRRNLKIGEAISLYAEGLADGCDALASKEDLLNAEQWCKENVFDWAEERGFPHTRKPASKLPSTLIQQSLSQFQGSSDVHFAEAIPKDKLENARRSCSVPDEEVIAVLIDCTFWGSAKDAVLFGTRAVYYHNTDAVEGFLPYSEMTNRTFSVGPGPAMVSLGDGDALSINGSQVNPADLVRMLERIRSQSESSAKQGEAGGGLSSIPGMNALKESLTHDVVNVLRNAEEYKRYGLSLPNGLLFYGPPGCGKTFIAQHLAKELSYEFYEVSPSSLASPYIHESVLKIKDVFAQAVRSSPSIVFVDEFEGHVPSRRSLGIGSDHKAEEVNEWLLQIGSCAERGILFIAATNEPWKIDEAIRRTGRLDKKFYIGLLTNRRP